MKRLLLPFLAVFFLAIFASCGGAPDEAPEYESPAEVLVAMKDAYQDTWYETMTFVQTVIQHNQDGSTDTTSWFEAMHLPGKLRIDIGGPETGDSWIFRNDSIYVFTDGTLDTGQPTYHPLLLLGFDVYFLESSSLINKLDSLGFDLTVLADTVWQGRDAYIVGAEPDEPDVQQFWIDKERLVFVRLLQNVGPNGSSMQEVQFNNYVPLGGGWIAPEVLFYIDGNMQLEEYYHTISEGVELDDRLFSPTEWNEADYWLER